MIKVSALIIFGMLHELFLVLAFGKTWILIVGSQKVTTSAVQKFKINNSSPSLSTPG